MDDTKNQILEKAIAMYQTMGIRGVTMDGIAQDLAISKKTLYQHFKDKDELVCVCVQMMLDKDWAEMQIIEAASQNIIEQMLKISVYLRSRFKGMNALLMHDLQKYHPKAFKIFEEHKNRCLTEKISESLSQGVKEGFFRPEINTEILSRLRMEQITLAFDPKMFPPDKFELSDIQNEFFEHFTYGLVSEKGYKVFSEFKQQQNQQQNGRS